MGVQICTGKTVVAAPLVLCSGPPRKVIMKHVQSEEMLIDHLMLLGTKSSESKGRLRIAEQDVDQQNVAPC